MKKLAVLVLLSQGCTSSVVTLKSADPISPSKCDVQVYTSKEDAVAEGKIEELCMVTGTSSGSFSHTVGTAVNKHKDEVCECGATAAYIKDSDAGTLGTASVTLVGFRRK